MSGAGRGQAESRGIMEMERPNLKSNTEHERQEKKECSKKEEAVKNFTGGSVLNIALGFSHY